MHRQCLSHWARWVKDNGKWGDLDTITIEEADTITIEEADTITIEEADTITIEEAEGLELVPC